MMLEPTDTKVVSTTDEGALKGYEEVVIHGRLRSCTLIGPLGNRLLTESLMILSNMTSGGTWKSKTKYCERREKSVFKAHPTIDCFLICYLELR